jgi:hypothetical protein
MSMRVVKEIVFVAMGDEIFRRKLAFNPDETLAPYDLTSQEYLALRKGDKEALVKLGLDEQLANYARMLFSKIR